MAGQCQDDRAGQADGAREGQQRQPVHEAVHSISFSSASADNLDFPMNPRAPERSINRPKSDRSRVETSTTAGGSGFAASSGARSRPLWSGSPTSSSTTSGRSWRDAANADAPSTASPIAS